MQFGRGGHALAGALRPEPAIGARQHGIMTLILEQLLDW